MPDPRPADSVLCGQVCPGSAWREVFPPDAMRLPATSPAVARSRAGRFTMAPPCGPGVARVVAEKIELDDQNPRGKSEVRVRPRARPFRRGLRRAGYVKLMWRGYLVVATAGARRAVGRRRALLRRRRISPAPGRVPAHSARPSAYAEDALGRLSLPRRPDGVSRRSFWARSVRPAAYGTSLQSVVPARPRRG
jgi:hypothetical protein